MVEKVGSDWDAGADRFDEQPDHGLLDPGVRRAWWRLLAGVLPPTPTRVLDLGCGTGSLAVLLAEHGYDVTGVDVSPRMVERAVAKVRQHGVAVDVRLGDAIRPPVDGLFDVLLERHVLWALPDVPAVLDTWHRLMAPGGTLVLVEGNWHTGTGLPSDGLVSTVTGRFRDVELRQVSADADLWGEPVDDERYLITAST